MDPSEHRISFSYTLADKARADALARQARFGPVGGRLARLVVPLVAVGTVLVFTDGPGMRVVTGVLASAFVLGVTHLTERNTLAGIAGRARRRGLAGMVELAVADGTLALRGADADVAHPVSAIRCEAHPDGVALWFRGGGLLWVPVAAFADAAGMRSFAEVFAEAPPVPGGAAAPPADPAPTARFVATVEDHRAAAFEAVRGQGAAVLVGLGAVAALVLRFAGAWAPLVLPGLLVGSVGGVLALQERRHRRLVAEQAGQPIAYTVRAGGVGVEAGGAWWEVPWARVGPVKRRAEGLVLTLVGVPHVLPRRAFADARSVAAFADAVDAAMEVAREKG